MKNKFLSKLNVFVNELEKWTFRIFLVYGIILLSLICLLAIFCMAKYLGVMEI